MKAGLRVAIVSALAILASGAMIVAGSPQQTSAPPGPPKAAAPAAPWPDEKTLAERRKVAENRALFADTAPLEFTLTADFKTVNKDRNPKSTKVFPATITVTKSDGTPVTFPLNIRTRGHVRRMAQTCSFAPLRLEFDAEKIKGTVFEGHKNIKLGTHCRDADLFEQYMPREYAAYRIFNLLTPRSFRARMGKARYVDATSKATVASRMALFIEDDDDVARRMEGRIIETQKLMFYKVDMETVTLMTLFENLIGNTDFSMFMLHNVVLVQTKAGTIYPVPYDFDYSGLVDARYAVPAKIFNLTSVRDRLYLGPCRPADQLAPFFTRMLAVKDKTLALFDSIPGLDQGYKKDAQKYLNAFYQTISKPGDAKRAFIDECPNRAGI
jgi:hypothetical protein